MKIFFAALASLVTLQSYSQTDSTKTLGDTNAAPVFMKIEIDAHVDQKTWMTYIEKAKKPYMEAARNKGIPDGSYPVTVKFIVEPDGSIVEATALNSPGYGLAAAAVKIMTTSPKWNPGIRNGRKVKMYRTQVINFVFP